MRYGSNLAELGTGRFDGEQARLTLSYPIDLIWNATAGKWRSPAQTTIELRDLDPMDAGGSLTEGAWAYVSRPQGSNPNLRAYGWQPTAIVAANEAYGAGLVGEEEIAGAFWAWQPTGTFFELAVVYYNFDVNGTIDQTIVADDSSPGRNVGTAFPTLHGQRRWISSGWVVCPIDAPTTHFLMPHVYSRWLTDKTDGSRLDGLHCRWRWSSP